MFVVALAAAEYLYAIFLLCVDAGHCHYQTPEMRELELMLIDLLLGPAARVSLNAIQSGKIVLVYSLSQHAQTS